MIDQFDGYTQQELCEELSAYAYDHENGEPPDPQLIRAAERALHIIYLKQELAASRLLYQDAQRELHGLRLERERLQDAVSELRRSQVFGLGAVVEIPWPDDGPKGQTKIDRVAGVVEYESFDEAQFPRPEEE